MNERTSTYRPFPAALWQTVVIVLLGSVIALAFNAIRDGGIPLVGSVRVVKFDTPLPSAPAEPVVADPSSVSPESTMAPVLVEEAEAEGGERVEEPVAGVAEPPAEEMVPAEQPVPVEESAGVEVFSALPVEETAEEGGDAGPMALDLSQALELFEGGGAVFVDARIPDEFVAGHIPGAFNLPYDDLGSHLDVLNYLPDDSLVITYCDGSECALSLELADELTAMGFGQVRVFFGGWEQWVEAGHPAEEGEALLP
jgi:rhodanese-related sulfurtransferase